MTTVRIVDGMKYGFKLLSFFIAVSLVCGAFIAGGVVLYQDARAMVNPELNQYYARLAAAGLLTLVGSLGLTGSLIGFGHKFIADSVTAGYGAADTPPVETPQAEPSDDETTEDESSRDDDSTDESAEESTPEPSSVQAAAEAPEERDERSGQDEGIFGIDTSKARAEPTEPGTRAEEPPSPQADEGRDSGEVRRHAQPTNHPPTSTEQRTWQRDEPEEPTGETTSASDQEQPETETDPGYPDSYATGPPQEDRDANLDEPADDQPIVTANDQVSDQTQDESPEEAAGNESNVGWEDDGVHENIDQVVGDATAPEPTDVDGSQHVDESLDADDGGTLEKGAEDEPESIDDAPGEFVAKPPADDADEETTNPVDELPDEPLTDEDEETTVDPAETLPDEPITDHDIEDTTDETGDWEPLDESDL